MGHSHSRIRDDPRHSHQPGGSVRSDRHRSLTVYTSAKHVSATPQARGNDPWAPPPYTEQTVATPVVSPLPADDDSPYAFLGIFDTVFLVDDSSSMRYVLGRWSDAEKAIAAIAPVCTKYDQDGIDIYFLNHRAEPYTNVKDPDDVRGIFHSIQPRGCTFVGKRLQDILIPYLCRVEAAASRGQNPSSSVKPLNIIVITDGEFSDDAGSIITQAAQRLDACNAVPWQVGIQFFQIGDDKDAQRYLQELDDELCSKKQNGMRDMVDTVPWKSNAGKTLEAEGILKCVLGAVNRRYDKRSAFS
ncbi:hypothetical protein BDV25DRAFT_156338 [Aspergillus avenaceus]|uniref:VWFA domain-containing protein n=1 Tax=Aspergillus avenaceus TaxID=36643 RepID=A0A5N6TT03_ASPAV|nr:hypothetical protein BDV25DRAFT_156338 [Aspergillus avenaceus]